MSSYQPNIPTGTVDLDQDYLNLQGNFQQINTTYMSDHVPLTDPSSQNGFHKAIHIVQQVAPIAVAGVGELYCTTNNDGINNTESLFFRSGTVDLNIRLTRNFLPSASTNGKTFLPGGLILQWGRVINPGSSGNVLFNVAPNINFPANVFNIQLSLQRNSGNQSVTIDNASPPSTTGFSYLASSGGSNFLYWVAIGN